MLINCVITVTLVISPWVSNKQVYLKGLIIGETQTQYVVDFSNSAKHIKNIDGDYSSIIVDKKSCSNKGDK